MNDIKWFEVICFVGGKEVHRDIVRSKEERTAITNVLTNKYKKNVTCASAYEVEVVRKIEKTE